MIICAGISRERAGRKGYELSCTVFHARDAVPKIPALVLPPISPLPVIGSGAGLGWCTGPADGHANRRGRSKEGRGSDRPLQAQDPRGRSLLPRGGPGGHQIALHAGVFRGYRRPGGHLRGRVEADLRLARKTQHSENCDRRKQKTRRRQDQGQDRFGRGGHRPSGLALQERRKDPPVLRGRRLLPGTSRRARGAHLAPGSGGDVRYRRRGEVRRWGDPDRRQQVSQREGHQGEAADLRGLLVVLRRHAEARGASPRPGPHSGVLPGQRVPGHRRRGAGDPDRSEEGSVAGGDFCGGGRPVPHRQPDGDRRESLPGIGDPRTDSEPTRWGVSVARPSRGTWWR